MTGPSPAPNTGLGAAMGPYAGMTPEAMLAAINSEKDGAWDSATAMWKALGYQVRHSSGELRSAGSQLSSWESPQAADRFREAVGFGVTSLQNSADRADAVHAAIEPVGQAIRTTRVQIQHAVDMYHQAQAVAEAPMSGNGQPSVAESTLHTLAADSMNQWRAYAAAQMLALDVFVRDRVTGLPADFTWTGPSSAGAAGPAGGGTGTGGGGNGIGGLGGGAPGGGGMGGGAPGLGSGAGSAGPADLGLGGLGAPPAGGGMGAGAGMGTGDTGLGDLGLGSPAGSPAAAGELGGTPATSTAGGLAGLPGSPPASGIDPAIALGLDKLPPAPPGGVDPSTALGLTGFGMVPGASGVPINGGVSGLPGLPGRPGLTLPNGTPIRFPSADLPHPGVPGISGVSHRGALPTAPDLGAVTGGGGGLGGGIGGGGGGGGGELPGLPPSPGDVAGPSGPAEITDPAQTMPTAPPGSEPVLAQSSGPGAANPLFAGTPGAANGMGGMGMGGMGMGGMGMAGMGMGAMNPANPTGLGLPGAAPQDARAASAEARTLARGGVRDALQGRVGRVGQGSAFGVPPQSAPLVGPTSGSASAAKTRSGRPGQDADERLWKVDKKPVNLEPKASADAPRSSRRRLAGG